MLEIKSVKSPGWKKVELMWVMNGKFNEREISAKLYFNKIHFASFFYFLLNVEKNKFLDVGAWSSFLRIYNTLIQSCLFVFFTQTKYNQSLQGPK